MRLSTPFSPLAPNEVDSFCFDFTPDVGEAIPTSTSWTCALAPGQSAGVDPTPQNRILSAGLQTTLVVTDPLTEQPLTKTGAFSVALVGTMPSSADGSTYVLTAAMTLSDTRMLVLSSVVLCSSTATR